MSSGGGSFQWEALIPYLVHPVKVAIIEASQWIEEPISARELDCVFDEQFGLPLVSYHVRNLAGMGVLKKEGQQSVRGALQTFYVLAEKETADSPCE